MTEYNNPFIPERADPYITKGDGCYYFTASYPAFHSEDKGYDRIILRASATVEGLAEAEERVIWHAHREGAMAKHIWAPEIHRILDKWYIFFAAGDSDNKWNIRPYALVCQGDNPMRDSWRELGRVRAGEGDEESFRGFSLDMTYFENGGRHYLIWAESKPDSSLFMAEIDPREPDRLISLPVLLTKPEYPWELVRFRVNEGPAVVKHGGRIFVFYSASGTGPEYCMGMVYAEAESDLMKRESWTKSEKPVLSTEDVEGESGPGHNSFTVDEQGRLLLVYHARPESHLRGECGTYDKEPLYDPCRHARIRIMTFDEKNMPVIER